MGEIINNVINGMGVVWNWMGMFELLPGLTVRELYFFTWIALILAEFFRVLIFSKIDDLSE